MHICIDIYIFIYKYIHIYMYGISSAAYLPRCGPPNGVGHGCRDAPPYFEAGQHQQKHILGMNWNVLWWAFAPRPPKGSELGYDIAISTMVARLPKMTKNGSKSKKARLSHA